jgi:uncharacterized alpha-E superfamily protein
VIEVLLSRVANACYWHSRYRERAEFTARVVDVNAVTLLDTSIGAEADWEPIVRINGCEQFFPSGDAEAADVLRVVCLEPLNSNSIVACVRAARENARQAREQISSEMWEQINEMYHAVNKMRLEDLIQRPHEILAGIKNGALLMQGLADQTMMHGEAYHFIQMGRYLERANTTCRLLAARADPAYNTNHGYMEALYWIAVLKSASSLEAYHKTYGAPVNADAAIEFLLLNEESPRSVLFCLEQAASSIRYAHGRLGQRFVNDAERLMGQLAARLHYLRLQDIDLIPFLYELQASLQSINDAITEAYFSYEVA